MSVPNLSTNLLHILWIERKKAVELQPKPNYSYTKEESKLPSSKPPLDFWVYKLPRLIFTPYCKTLFGSIYS